MLPRSHAPPCPCLQVFDQALQGGGAKSINFQDLAADLAQITFDYPFQIPPYFALIIRAISVLEGIALKANPEFAIVDEAYPYIAQRLLVDNSPRLRAALRYMVRRAHPLPHCTLQNFAVLWRAICWYVGSSSDFHVQHATAGLPEDCACIWQPL